MDQCPQCGFVEKTAPKYQTIEEMPRCTRCDGNNVLIYYDVTRIRLQCDRGHWIKWISPTLHHLKLLEAQAPRRLTSEQFLRENGIIGPDEC